MRKLYVALAFAGVCLAGCAGTTTTNSAGVATTAPSPVQTAVAKVQTITVADLTAAAADATAHNDKQAYNCWEGLIPIVQGISLPIPASPPVGLASAIQAARDVVKFAEGFSGGLPSATVTAIEDACGPAALDAQTDINKGIIMFGGKAISLISAAALPAGL